MSDKLEHPLFDSIKELIEQSKQQIAISVNATMSMLYWQIGKTIKQEILQNNRADYGEKIVQSLSTQLEREYGKGWSKKHLRHCLLFATAFINKEIVSAMWRQLSWTHILAIIPIEDPLNLGTIPPFPQNKNCVWCKNGFLICTKYKLRAHLFVKYANEKVCD